MFVDLSTILAHNCESKVSTECTAVYRKLEFQAGWWIVNLIYLWCLCIIALELWMFKLLVTNT